MPATFVTRSKLRACAVYAMKRIARRGRPVDLAWCGKGDGLRYFVQWV